MKCGDLGAPLGIVLAVTLGASAQDDLARELPRIKPLEPAAALRSFRIQPGFHLERVAAEPMVINPVSACYDADGRLYVVEMCGYPYPEKDTVAPLPGGRDVAHAIRLEIEPFAERGASLASSIGSRSGSPGLCRVIH